MNVFSDKFSRSVDLTDDCGATVSVRYWSHGCVSLSMGGDLSISITMPAASAHELGLALLDAVISQQVEA